MNAIEEILIQQQRRAIHIGSDFTDKDCLAAWNTLEADAAASVASDVDGVGGIVTLDVATTDNEECYLYSNEIFDFGVSSGGNDTLVAEARIKYTEASTDDANIIFGFSNAVAANHLVDDGAGPPASYTGAVIYKVDGGTYWQAEASVTTAQQGGTSTTLATPVTTYQTLRIEAHSLTTTRMDVSFLIDPAGGSNFVPLKDSQLNALKYELDITTTTEMALFIGLKNGDTNTESVLVDYMHGIQIRKT